MKMTTRICELPDDERPREKLARHGGAALADSELLAILLRTGLRGLNVIELSRQLLARFGSLSALQRASVNELATVKGVSLAKATQLAAAFELGNRLARERTTRSQMDRPELVYDLLGQEMRALQRESLRVLLLDTRLHLLRVEEISLGSLNESIAHPREIFRPVFIHAAFAIVIVHNHPSGDPSPSDADHRLTRRLAEAARIMQITLLDHIILGSPAEGRRPYFSFREAGIL
jgi:DNA repair protein RadC